MKKLLSLTMVLTMVIGLNTNAFANQTDIELTPEQKAVIEDFETNVVHNVEELDIDDNRTERNMRYTGHLHRGSFLAWSEDHIEWTTSGNSVTGSTAWQRSGFVFPNIVRTNGIVRHATGTSSREYRASKTLGAGVVSPWGDITIYETNYTDIITVNSSGQMFSREQ